MPPLNIVIPMAGRGSRFAVAGYTVPKPLVPTFGRPMIEVVIENLRPKGPHRFIFICQSAHIRHYGLDACLPKWAPGCEIIGIDCVTEGAACTVLLAKALIDNGSPLMIANSDQWVSIDIDAYLDSVDWSVTDGLIMTMPASDPKWSYVQFDARGNVAGVVEKEVVSNEATVGIYNFARGTDYCLYAEQMIARDLRSKGEFYVAPVYSLLIESGGSVGIYNVENHGGRMYGLGTPEDHADFVSHENIRHKLAGSLP